VEATHSTDVAAHQTIGTTSQSLETAAGHVLVGGDSLDNPPRPHRQDMPDPGQTGIARGDSHPLSTAAVSTILERPGVAPDQPSGSPPASGPLLVTATPSRRDIPQFESRPVRATPTPAAHAEPLVQIGNIEIIIEAPAPVPSVGGDVSGAAHFASRYYLRSL
jgi:hypothetical protein